MTDISPFPHQTLHHAYVVFPQSQHMKMYIYQAGTDFSEMLSFIKRLTEWLFIKLHSP